MSVRVDGDAETFEGWAVLELMGHVRTAGFVSEATIAGQALLRLDVPGVDGGVVATQYYGASAVYCLSPVSEQVARAVAVRSFRAPVQRWDLPALPAPAAGDVDVVDDDEGLDADDDSDGWDQ